MGDDLSGPQLLLTWPGRQDRPLPAFATAAALSLRLELRRESDREVLLALLLLTPPGSWQKLALGRPRAADLAAAGLEVRTGSATLEASAVPAGYQPRPVSTGCGPNSGRSRPAEAGSAMVRSPSLFAAGTEPLQPAGGGNGDNLWSTAASPSRRDSIAPATQC